CQPLLGRSSGTSKCPAPSPAKRAFSLPRACPRSRSGFMRCCGRRRPKPFGRARQSASGARMLRVSVKPAAPSANPIVWIDCEMTGLDLTKDALIEIAVIVTDSELNPLSPGLDLVIKPPAGATDDMVDVVREMHTESGLLEELDSGTTLADAEAQVLAHIQHWVPKERTAPLAGNSVGTDKMFLERDMPTLTNFLHYRIIDVSSIKELARRWHPRAYFNS